MYAVLRLNSIDSAKLEASADRLREFDKIHAAQPCCVGSVVVDWERRSALNLWDTEQHSAAAMQVLAPEIRRLLERLIIGPSQLLEAGT